MKKVLAALLAIMLMPLIAHGGEAGSTQFAREGKWTLGSQMAVDLYQMFYNRQLNFSPAIGYFFRDNLEVAFGPSFSFYSSETEHVTTQPDGMGGEEQIKEKDKHSGVFYGVTVNPNYYFDVGSNIFPYAAIAGGYFMGSFTDKYGSGSNYESTSSGYNYSLGAGLAAATGDENGLVMRAGLTFSGSHSDSADKSSDDEEATDSLGFSFNMALAIFF